MRRTLLLLAIAAAFAVAALALAPATLADAWVQRASNASLRLAAAEGTIWRGRGALIAARDARVPLAWTLDPWPLMRGELRLALSPYDAAATQPRGEISVRGRTFAVRALDVVLPATLLRNVTGRGMDVTGEMHFATPSLDFDAGGFRGGAEVAWRAARIATGDGGGVDLGTMNATLHGEDNVLRGTIANSGGDVDVGGSIAAGAAGTELSLLITPRRAGDASTTRLLAAIGTPEGAGYRIVLRQ